MGFDRARRTPAGVAGRSALVTGGASGIGRAIAERLAAEGAGVIVVDLPGEALDAAAGEIAGASALPCDLAAREQVHRLVERVGAVDILVANAGLQHVSPLEEFPEEAWDRLLAVMLTAPFLLARALLPGMYAAGWGRVINIASVHGLVASPFKSAYVAAKHGLVGLTKVIALEAAARCPDVTAHAICPSYVRTPLVERQIEAQARAHGIDPQDVVAEVLLEANAVKRLLEPADVADAVVYLCGPSAWALTGGAFALDAGWLAH
ncbi:MAG TPA: 3-hydroxybutyrate dehydrogenase [Gaiellaceae bacterium]|jgi:3-hydroxybutyrate dehydrogenase|nr:3-hydroxybutyrate dehydrogenase [Gaiellaceae bacterium]